MIAQSLRLGHYIRLVMQKCKLPHTCITQSVRSVSTVRNTRSIYWYQSDMLHMAYWLPSSTCGINSEPHSIFGWSCSHCSALSFPDNSRYVLALAQLVVNFLLISVLSCDRSEGGQFLCRCWMDANSLVKLRLGDSSLHCCCKTLQATPFTHLFAGVMSCNALIWHHFCHNTHC